MFKSRFYFTGNAILNGLKAPRMAFPQTHRGFYFSTNQAFNIRNYSAATIKAVKSKTIPTAPKVDPIISNKSVSYWLFGTSTLVFGIVVLGGLTRLTESGLSITEWKPITGTIPPLNQKEWESEFNKYQESPEFKQLNSHITLEEFKFIFSMEWGHRLMGRCIGMFFILPAIYFWSTRKLSPHVKWRVVGLTGLLGLQGAIGWWMVKSGLDEQQLTERNSKPTVSQYRLTTHLGAAFLMYLGVLWTGLEILNENNLVKQAKANPQYVASLIEKLGASPLNRLRTIAYGLLGLTFMTAMSGGMVAGLDAGLIYNTFPHMGDDYIPSSSELLSPVFSRKSDLSDLWWRNLFENPTTVQLVHRILATSTFFSILGAHMYAVKKKAIIPRPAMRALGAVMGLVTLQASLGITTLIYLVPIPLAALHQAGALALLTGCVTFCSRLKKIRPQALNQLVKLVKI